MKSYLCNTLLRLRRPFCVFCPYVCVCISVPLFVHVFISAHFMCISMQAWECWFFVYTHSLSDHMKLPYIDILYSRWQARPRMVISQVDLGTPWGMGSVWLSQDITWRHILLHTHHKPMKMITFDTQMTFYPCCDNTGSFFCSDIRCCVGVIQVKSIILMEK